MPVMGMMPIVIPTRSWNTLKAMKAKEPGADQAAEDVPGHDAGVQDPPGDDAQEGEHGRAPHEAELLPYRGEDEVSLLLGHGSPEIGLRPVADTRTEDAARPDGVLGLLPVVEGFFDRYELLLFWLGFRNH